MEKFISEVAEMDFNFQSPIAVESGSNQLKVKISGCLLKEGLSRNAHLYTIDEMENIARQCEGLPLEYGTEMRIEDGRLLKNRHASSPRIGKIIRAWLDKINRKIYYVAEVYGQVARQILADYQSGKRWKVSIDGLAKNAKYYLTDAGKLIIKVGNLVMRKLQLIPSEVIAGVEGTEIQSAEIEEVMQFNEPISARTLAVIMHLYDEGEI